MQTFRKCSVTQIVKAKDIDGAVIIAKKMAKEWEND